MRVQFETHGIRVEGKLYPASYVLATAGATPTLAQDCITIFLNGYGSLPGIPGLTIENHTDIQTDYFDHDTIRVPAGHPFYEQVKAAHDKQRIFHAGREGRREKRRKTMSEPPKERKTVNVSWSNHVRAHVLSADGSYPAIYTPAQAARAAASVPKEYEPTIFGRGRHCYVQISLPNNQNPQEKKP